MTEIGKRNPAFGIDKAGLTTSGAVYAHAYPRRFLQREPSGFALSGDGESSPDT